jgi:hypothetical protein
MTLENIDFSININYLILLLLLVLSIGYTYYNYRYTIPATTPFIKTILIILRSISIILLIAILFEPTIKLNYLEKKEPINLLLIDNSSSIVNKDSTNRSNSVNKFLADYKNSVAGNVKIATFGKVINTLNLSEETSVIFDEPLTNFEQLVPFIKEEKELISTITIVSDGIITDGTNSTDELEKLNIPIFTVAIGDTVKPSDIMIKKVEFNRLIYLNNETEINGVISNRNFANKNVVVSLFDKSGVIEQKQITLNETGINNITFNYKPKEVGKQNLALNIAQLENEDTFENNKYPFVIEVLNDKTNVLIIAGAPSTDLSMLMNSLSNNENIRTSIIIQISNNLFSDDVAHTTKIDSADIIFMIDFPSPKTPGSLLELIVENISTKNTPYFLILSELTDYSKLMSSGKIFPFDIKNSSKGFSLVTTKVISNGSGIITNESQWNGLAPINVMESKIELNKGVSILATYKPQNEQSEIPLIFTQKIASSRRMIFNGFNFWKWQLQSDKSIESLFGSFFRNSIKWLSSKKDKRIFVTTTKNIFNSNESIEFLGNVYDETLTPVNNASIQIEISSDDFRKTLKLNLTKNGIYYGRIDISKPGVYNYIGTIAFQKENPKVVNGNFLISDIDVENISFVLNSNYLKFISNVTSGKSYDLDSYSDLFPSIKQLSKIKTKNQVTSTKFEIWRNSWILIIIILLFAIEWIIRKQKGML